MKKMLFLLSFLFYALNIDAAASSSGDSVEASSDTARDFSEFVRFLGLSPEISSKCGEGEFSPGFFLGKRVALSCFFVGHEDPEVRKQILEDISHAPQYECMSEWHEDNQDGILRTAVLEMYKGLSDERLAHVSKPFVAALFLTNASSSACEKVEIKIFQMSDVEERRRSHFLPKDSVLHYIAGPRKVAGCVNGRVYRDLEEDFGLQWHVQEIKRRLLIGTLKDKSVLTRAFDNFLKEHKTFGFEIDGEAACRFMNGRMSGAAQSSL